MANFRLPAPTQRTRMLARIALPAVTVLLLLAALGTTLAWQEARHERVTSREQDQTRIDTKADSISSWLRDQQQERDKLLDANAQVLVNGSVQSLETWLQSNLSDEGTGALAGSVITGPRGEFQAVGEARTGELTSDRTVAQLRALAVQTVTRDAAEVSGRIMLDDDTAGIAIALPLKARTGGRYGAYIVVYRTEESSLGAFVPGASGFSPTVFALIDDRGNVIAGPRPRSSEDDRLEVHVSGTPWSLLLARDQRHELLPQWIYPGFAMIMVLLALVAAWQEVAARKLRAASSRRTKQVRGLLDLSSRMLHATSVDRQAEHLARAMMSLLTISGATVVIADSPAVRKTQVGDTKGPAVRRRYSVAIVGNRGVIGELVINRARGGFSADERTLTQTAATLTGAAMHTIGALETERQAAEELLRLDDLRNNMLAIVAHELRSPITTVKGVLGLLAMQDDLGNQNEEYVQLATERTDSLIALIDDLFDCSLLDTGELDIHPERRPAVELVESALGARAAARSGELVLDVDPELQIDFDPVRFDQMLNNLVTNAFRHGAAPVHVSLRADGLSGARLVVTDEGVGIPESERERIFEKFHQASRGHDRAVSGAGLGLALVDGLVRLHGGSITVDSHRTDGRGTRFTVLIPDADKDLSAVA